MEGRASGRWYERDEDGSEGRAVAGGYLAGPGFSLADICFTPVLYYMSKFPESSALLAGQAHLPACLDRQLRRRPIADAIPHMRPGGR